LPDQDPHASRDRGRPDESSEPRIHHWSQLIGRVHDPNHELRRAASPHVAESPAPELLAEVAVRGRRDDIPTPAAIRRSPVSTKRPWWPGSVPGTGRHDIDETTWADVFVWFVRGPTGTRAPEHDDPDDYCYDGQDRHRDQHAFSLPCILCGFEP
jgi:hypothetical protein